MNEFKQVTKVRLPFDRRHQDGSKNYGIGGLSVWFVLVGPKGAVQFAVSFPTYLPHVNHFTPEREFLGIDVGYHSPKPMYEDQMIMGECEHVEGGKCYYDGSGLRAQEWTNELFSTRGETIEPLIWKRLEEEYVYRFEENRAKP